VRGTALQFRFAESELPTVGGLVGVTGLARVRLPGPVVVPMDGLMSLNEIMATALRMSADRDGAAYVAHWADAAAIRVALATATAAALAARRTAIGQTRNVVIATHRPGGLRGYHALDHVVTVTNTAGPTSLRVFELVPLPGPRPRATAAADPEESPLARPYVPRIQPSVIRPAGGRP